MRTSSCPSRWRLAPWWSLWIPLLATGCPSTPPPQRRARAVRRPGPSTRVVVHTLRLEVPAEAHPAPRLSLPAFPPFRDPVPLPKRSLKRERKLGFTAKGRTRLLVHTHLAARLWAMANQNLKRIRQLERRARRRDGPVPRDRIERLRREASAHLRECVTLLEGVLEVKDAPRLARVRLAHYLRHLKPVAAIPHFRILVRQTREVSTRRRYAVDLAQLLLAAGKPAEALAVLRKSASPLRTPRARLIRALCRARAARPGGGADDKDLRSLVAACDGLSPGIRAPLLSGLPELLAVDPAPSAVLSRLARRAPTCWTRHGVAVATRAAEVLLFRGRPEQATRLSRRAAAQGATLPASIRRRAQRMGGPWARRAKAPGRDDWTRWVRQRLRPLSRCYGRRTAAGVTVTVRVRPDGTARLRGAPPPRRSRSAATAAAAAATRRCVQRRVASWRFPGWQTAVAVELRLQLTGPAAP